MQIDFANESGIKRKFTVSKMDNKTITFDGNHLFAGKDLNYKIKIIDVTNTEVVQE
jgi:FKBP-type peptidyl-prolyl cis-trans isomerase 2